jgi:hypothetical protein
MRSWTGVIQLTSDELGLSTLVRMLRDTKVSPEAQGAILDAIYEVFEPVVSQVKKVRGVHPSAAQGKTINMPAGTDTIPTKTSSSSSLNAMNAADTITLESAGAIFILL